MTDDYKLNVLKYITGNLQEEESINTPQFKNVQSITNNLTTQIESHFISIVIYTDFVPSKNNKNQDLEYSVISCYGTLPNQSQTSGAFVILDKEYNIVQIIDHYSDGSLIGNIQCLNVDDKGNYYAIELNGSTFRIVALNNLVLKPVNSNTYQAIKKEVHNIPNQYTWGNFLKVFRNDGGNKYFAVGIRESTGEIAAGELTISNNDSWVWFTSTCTKLFAFSMLDNGYNVYWDSNSELQFQIAGRKQGLVMLTKGTSVAMRETRYLTDDYDSTQNNFIFANNNMGYYSMIYDSEDETKTYYKIYKIDLLNKTNKVIFSSVDDATLYSWLWFFKNNNGIYYYRTIRTENDEHEFNLIFGFINDTNISEQLLGTFSASIFLNAFCYPNVVTDFNKNYIYIQNQDKLFSLDFIWNPNNYNGIPYNSINSLMPNVITVEDENEQELFNRNLYNLSSYSNWYTASVLIPNYFLNEQQLYNSLLYSKANNLLVSGNINTTKNIYEELLINFTNKFNIINNNIENITASSQLVNGMMTQNNQAYIGKYKINYDDETNSIRDVSIEDLIYSDLSTTLKITLYVDKKINSIELLSKDETISYITIDCSSLEENKYYLITQNIGIE